MTGEKKLTDTCAIDPRDKDKPQTLAGDDAVQAILDDLAQDEAKIREEIKQAQKKLARRAAGKFVEENQYRLLNRHGRRALAARKKK